MTALEAFDSEQTVDKIAQKTLGIRFFAVSFHIYLYLMSPGSSPLLSRKICCCTTAIVHHYLLSLDNEMTDLSAKCQPLDNRSQKRLGNIDSNRNDDDLTASTFIYRRISSISLDTTAAKSAMTRYLNLAFSPSPRNFSVKARISRNLTSFLAISLH